MDEYHVFSLACESKPKVQTESSAISLKFQHFCQDIIPMIGATSESELQINSQIFRPRAKDLYFYFWFMPTAIMYQ